MSKIYVNSTSPLFPNKYERALILFMSRQKIITFQDQKEFIFSDKLSFKNATKNLHKLKIINWRREKNGCNEYKLTENFGEHIAEILKEFL